MLEDRTDRHSRRSFLSRSASGAAALALTGAGAPVLLDACSNSGSGGGGGGGGNGIDTSTPVHGGKLTVGMASEVSDFRPSKGRFDTTGTTFANCFYDPLAYVDINGRAQPYLAESFTPNADYTAWTVALRPNITFHDGSPLNADVAIANLNAYRSSALTGSAVTFITGVVKTGPLTYTISMNEPIVQFPFGFCTQIGYVASLGELLSKTSTKPIGTGPFKFVSWTPNQQLVMERNPNYWRSGLPYLDGVTTMPIVDDNSREEALRSGEIQLMVSRNPSAEHAFAGNASYQQVTPLSFPVGVPSSDMICLNGAANPTNDLIVRQALAYAINYDELVTLFSGPRSVSPFFANSSYYAKNNGFPNYDLQKAQQLVAQAKPQHGGQISVNLVTIPDPTLTGFLQTVQQMWQAAGISATISQIPEAELTDKLLLGDYQAMLIDGFAAPDPDANNFYWNGKTASPVGALALNFARNKDPIIDAALNTGRTTTSATLRDLAYQTIDKRFAADLPYLWMRHTPWSLTGTQTVRNFAGPHAPSNPNLRLQGFTSGAFTLVETWKQA